MKVQTVQDSQDKSLFISAIFTENSLKPVRKKIKILLVEDEFLIQKINQSLLEDLGYEVSIANNGREAISFFEKETCDLVLTDIHMPILSGYEAADYLRQVLRLAIPIIAFTTDVSEETKTACFKAGMNAVAEKPLRAAELKILLEKYVEHY